MLRFLSFLFILSCLCTYPKLLCFIKADNDDTNDDSNNDTSPTRTLCDAKTKSGVCANLGNISYPFGAAVPCAASDSLLINCSNLTQAYWDAFTPALGSDEAKLGAPAVDGIFTAGNNFSFINLTWNLGFFMEKSDPCGPPLLADTVDAFIPEVIDLTSFANGSFYLSSYNHILLLNCANLPSTLLEADNSVCQDYQQQCNQFPKTPCAQIPVPTQQLKLHEALTNFSCTHFQFFVAAETLPQISTWSPGLIQLFNGDVKCVACYVSNGTCIYSSQTGTRTFQECACGNGTFSDTDCNHLRSCEGLICKTAVKITIGVVSTVVATVILMLLVLWVHRRRRYSTKSFTAASSNRLLTQRAYMLSKKFGPVDTKEFSFDTLSKATNSFADDNMIGDGGFGAVYYGVLKDSRKIAVKRLYHDNFKRMDHFYNEIQILSKIYHPNLVKLYGFCCQDSNDLLLVFEYASNGTVSDQLHDATKPAMTWKTRLNIARETAEALSYLHNSVSPPIFHRDVKTTNILLDDGLHAKLADFGLSRLVPLQATHVSTAPQGTPGYLDPDYHQCYQLTDKSDVYSFGVVLVELVSAKLAVDMSRDRREINLSNLALMKIGCGQWEDLVDPRLEIKKNLDVERMVKRVVELAFMCLNAEKDARPTMKNVVETLTSLCKEFDYRHDDDGSGGFSFKVAINGASPVDETSQLIKSKSTSESPLHSMDSPPSSTGWRSSNASSFVNSF